MRTRLALVAVAGVAVLGVLAGWAWPHDSADGPAFNRNSNGIWLDVDWVSRPRDDREIAALSHDLVAKGFRYAYVYVNSVRPSGEPVPSTYAYADRFVAAARQAEPDLRLIGWVGVVNAARGHGLVPIGEPAVRANIAAYARELTHDLGFDGVQLNVEPLPNGSVEYLQLLAAVRQAIGPDRLLSVAGHKWSPPIIPYVDRYSSYWKSDYYQAVAEVVDQVAVMTYDSYAPTAAAYRLFQREQTIGVLRALAGSDVEVLVGVPTYEEPRPNHNPEAENMETGLLGVADALARADPAWRANFGGVAVYAHWVTDAAEWDTYRRLWLGENGRAR